jgi:hydrogenase nickel incorporation protein HypB
MEIKVLKNVLEANDALAARIRDQLRARNITTLNLISAPGAGKTSLLEQTIPKLKSQFRIAVLEGDIAGTRDAERIQKLGVPVVQLLTGGACHLEAPLVQRGLGELDLNALDLLLIENVGNIACPAEFDLGETCKVGILSITEGHDKPAKYPLLFHEIAALVLNKIDLLPYTNFDRQQFLKDFRKLNADAPVFELSCRTGAGLGEWTHWLEHVAEGELHVAPHTHSAVEGIQPHAHPHQTHHTEVSRQ